MKRFGIDNSKALGVSMPKVRQLAKRLKRIRRWHLSFGKQTYTNAGYWLHDW